jgi:exportin-T
MPFSRFVHSSSPLSLVGNKGQLEGLLGMMERSVVDLTDPAGQRSALQFLARCVNVWAVASPDGTPQALPGFEGFIYERLVPATFRVLSLPEFNTKDGQILLVSEFLYPVHSTFLY